MCNDIQFPSTSFEGVADFSLAMDPILERIVPSLAERVQKILIETDIFLPRAYVTLRGRLKELIPHFVAGIGEFLENPICLETTAITLREVKDLVRQFFGVTHEPSDDVPMYKEGPFNSLAEGREWARACMQRRLLSFLPSSLKDLELQLLLFQAGISFLEHSFPALGQGGKEKPLMDEEKTLLQTIPLQLEKLRSMVGAFESFVVEEGMRDLALKRKTTDSQPFDLPSYLSYKNGLSGFMEFCEERSLQEEVSSITTKLSPEELEKDPLLKAELKLQTSEIQDFLPFLRKFGEPLITSFLKKEPIPLAPISTDLLQKYSQGDLIIGMLFFTLISLMPDIIEQLEPLYLRLCRGHTSVLLPFFSCDAFLSDLLKSLHTVQPETELGERFKEFWISQLSLFFSDELSLGIPPSSKRPKGVQEERCFV